MKQIPTTAKPIADYIRENWQKPTEDMFWTPDRDPKSNWYRWCKKEGFADEQCNAFDDWFRGAGNKAAINAIWGEQTP